MPDGDAQKTRRLFWFTTSAHHPMSFAKAYPLVFCLNISRTYIRSHSHQEKHPTQMKALSASVRLRQILSREEFIVSSARSRGLFGARSCLWTQVRNVSGSPRYKWAQATTSQPPTAPAATVFAGAGGRNSNKFNFDVRRMASLLTSLWRLEG